MQYNERKFEMFKYIIENGGCVEYQKLKEKFPTKFRSVYEYRKWKYLKIHHKGKSPHKYVTLYEKGKRCFKKMKYLKQNGLSLNIRKELIAVK